MQGKYSYCQNQQYGWNNTSQDYADYIAKIERMPSMVVTDHVPSPPPHPRFPSVYKAFTAQDHNNRVIIQEDHLPRLNPNKHHHAPETRKKVHFVEQEEKKITEIDNTQDLEEFDVNMAADGFINQNRKNFQLYKWATFKSV